MEVEKQLSDINFTINTMGKEMYRKVDKIEEKLNSKVSYKNFYLIIGFLVTLSLGISGIIYTKVEKISEDTTQIYGAQTANSTNVINLKEDVKFIKELLGTAVISK